MTGRPLWDRVGDTFEIMSLTPSFLATGCYHSMISGGMLRIDTPFSCQRKEKTMTPPPAPPAPPSASELTATTPAPAAEEAHVGTPTSNVTTAPEVAPPAPPAEVPVTREPLLSKQDFIALCDEIERIARAIPTPNVTDSHLHGRRLGEIAEKLRKFADE